MDNKAFRSLIPVESFVRHPASVKDAVIEPPVGVCFGKQSAFRYTPQAQVQSHERMQNSGGFTHKDSDDGEKEVVQRIIPATFNVGIETVKVYDPNDAEAWIKVARFKSMSISYSEDLEKRSINELQRQRHTLWDLAFALHPENEEIDSGGA